MAHFFYIDPTRIRSKEATITGPEARHIATVMRRTIGDRLQLIDGRGSIYTGTIVACRKQKITLTITEHHRQPYPEPAIHLAVGLPKGKKLDFILQKAVELGVAAIYPFHGDHCAKRSAAAALCRRGNRILLEACKQCGLAWLPTLTPLAGMEELLAVTGNIDRRLLCWEQQGGMTMTTALENGPPAAAILLIIGPEGGFSAEEIATARKAKVDLLSLGPRILRTETAAIAALAVCQYLVGQLS